MTVRELMEKLSKLPPNAIVHYEGGEFLHDYRQVRDVTGVVNLGWGKEGILIK